jgi:hypothetical protein
MDAGWFFGVRGQVRRCWESCDGGDFRVENGL